MTITMTLLFFIYGIVFGSFFNVVGLRVPKKQSIVSPPSHLHNIVTGNSVTFDLDTGFFLPIAKREMQGCGSKISPIYPFMEFVTGGPIRAIVLHARFYCGTYRRNFIYVASCHHHGVGYRIYAYSE